MQKQWAIKIESQERTYAIIVRFKFWRELFVFRESILDLNTTGQLRSNLIPYQSIEGEIIIIAAET